MICRTALYMRISRDDEGEGESASISTQRNILREYAQAHQLLPAAEYVDDGYSGTNLERPEIQRLLRDIEAGQINCVITKDFSRLARNGARSIDLLDEFFPRYNVRYISVNDGYDSLHLTGGMSISAALMATIHETYARDISYKIRSSLTAKMKHGQFIGNFAPYGYQKDPKDKNHLIPDPVTAPIVQQIFRLAADGKPPGEIARQLNAAEIASPAVYRCMTHPHLNIEHYSTHREWTSSGICKLLRNEVYCGSLQQGKTSNISFKSKDVRKNPRDTWVVTPHAHEPLVSEAQFALVRRRTIARRSPPTGEFHNIFSGIAVCADCGHHMTSSPSRKKGALYNLCCGTYKQRGAGACSNHFIDYALLYDTVLHDLQAHMILSSEEKNRILANLQKAEAERRLRKSSRDAADRLEQLEARQRDVSRLSKKLYEDYALARIPESAYQRMAVEYEAELASLTGQIETCKRSMAEREDERDAYKKFFALLEEVTEATELSRPLLNKLIDRIEIGQGCYVTGKDGRRHKVQEIRIFYRFIGAVEPPLE
ncbi:MAG: recombinase family protein [Clostridia bacterium]|nr:recombinase family protein [Clostridia bacterium]